MAGEIGSPRIGGLADRLGSLARPEPSGSRIVVFRRDGDGWMVGPSEQTFRLRGSRGLEQLHRMLRHEGRDFTAVELVRADASDVASAAEADDLVASSGEGGDELLDERARSEYRAQLDSLRAGIDEAEANNDVARAEALRAERDRIADVVAAATGLGGRSRRHASGAERARVNVTRTVRDAIKRIREHDPALGEHLEARVRTGRLCGYAADPLAPIEWLLETPLRSS